MRQQQWTRRLLPVLAVGLLLLAPGCRTSCTYGTGDVARQDWGSKSPGFVEPVYVAAPGAPLLRGQDRAQDWAELGGSLREHMLAAGLRPTSAAPRTEAEAMRLLEAERGKGDPLVFVNLNLIVAGGEFHDSIGLLYIIGLVPGLIGFAIPMHEEFGMAQLCALVVDPKTDERLGVFWAQAQLNETATGYGYNPKALAVRAVKAAAEDLLGQVAKATREGFEDKGPALDGLAAALVQHGAPGLRTFGDKNPTPILETPPGAPPPPAPATPPPGPAASPTATNTKQFLDHYKELVKGETTVAQTLALLGAPSVDQMRDGRRMLFWVHSQPEGGKIVTRMLTVYFKGDVVDEVQFATT